MLTPGARSLAIATGLLMLAGNERADAQATWQLTRDLRIDAIDQDLAPIDWLLVSPNGTIVVSQQQDTVLVFFDARGQRLGTFGRGGGGPGEFRRMVRAGWMADTLWVSDVLQRRLTFITPDRKLARTQLQLPTVNLNGKQVDSISTSSGVVPYGVFADGRMVVSVAQWSQAPVQWPGGIAGETAYLYVNPAGDFLNVMGTGQRGPCSISYRFDRGSGSVGIPFCGRPMTAFASDASRFAAVSVEDQSARSVAYRVTVTRTNGDTAFSRRYTVPPVSIPRSVAEEQLEVASRRSDPFPGANDAREKALEKVKVPPVFPPYRRVVVGSDETAWVELYRRDEPRIWQVLDGRGNDIGRVHVPWNVEIHVASRTAIWGVETDDDGIEHIVRYRIRDNP